MYVYCIDKLAISIGPCFSLCFDWNLLKCLLCWLMFNRVAEVCCLCKATAGRRDFTLVYSNVNDNAGWKETIGVEHPWEVRPKLCDLIGDGLANLQLDMMHLWHLGVLQDLLGTVIKLLARGRHVYSGSTIKKRFVAFNRELRAYCREHKLTLSCKRIRKETICWRRNGCPTLKSKAADAAVILEFCNYKLQVTELPFYPGLTACVWAAHRFSGCMMNAGMFMSAEERSTTVIAGKFFLRSYMLLAREALHVQNEHYFKIRPKIHYIQHVLERLQQSCRNPTFACNFMDEDWLKYAMGLKRKMAHKTSPHWILKRFCVFNKTALDASLGRR